MASRGRGRPKKPRESRMDAAVDAMVNFGFEEKAIKVTVKELLQVYGGSDAWPLIEDSCYSVLLELLLSKNKEKDGEGEPSQNRNEEGANQPEETMALETCVNTTVVDTEPPNDTPVGDTEPPNDDSEQYMDTTPGGSTAPPMPPNAEPPFSDITDNGSGTDNTGMEEPPGGVNLENTDTHLPPAVLPPPPAPPVNTIPKQRRRPCYGWISDDEEDIYGIVHLPARVPGKTVRKSRWDIGPNET